MSDVLRHLRSGVVASLVLLAIGAAEARVAQSGTAAAHIDVERLGPQVGSSLPDFALRDQHGQPQSLKSLLGPRGAIIVFFRSADW